jgi:hypothetical protein
MVFMKKMIVRTALLASFALTAVSLSACGPADPCPKAVGSTVSTNAAVNMAASAMLPAKGSKGSGSKSSKSRSNSKNKTSGTTRGLNGTENRGSGSTMPWFGGYRTAAKCPNPTIAPTAPSSKQLR